jgi:hypothetical protein
MYMGDTCLEESGAATLERKGPTTSEPPIEDSQMADSIREALTTAFEKAAPTEEEVDEKPISNAGADDAPITSEEVTAEVPAPSAAEKAGDEVADPKAAAAAGTPPPAPQTPAVPPAPASWTTEERTAWATVPEGARKAILRREGEMQRALQSSASARKQIEQLNELAEPYKPLMDRYGVTVLQALPPLLATRAALEVGTPEQKATLVANICAEYGVPLEALDSALSARFANGIPQPVQPPVIPDLSNHPALAPLFAVASQLKERQQAAAEEAVSVVQSLPYYEEVRFTMADLLDKAKERGKTLDLTKSYELACQIHGYEVAAPKPGTPSVSEAAAILARSRKAASSVSGAPVPAAARKPGEGSVRDEIEALMASGR